MMSIVLGTIPAMLEGTEEFSIHSLGSSHQLCLVASHKNAVLQRNPKSFTATTQFCKQDRTAQPPKDLSIPKRGKYGAEVLQLYHQLLNWLLLLPPCSSSRVFQAQLHAGQTTGLGSGLLVHKCTSPAGSRHCLFQTIPFLTQRVPCNALALNLFSSEHRGPSLSLMNVKSKQYLWKKSLIFHVTVSKSD